MKSKKWIFVLCSFLASFFLVACQSGSNGSQSAVEAIKQKGKLVVATSPDYAPFEFQSLVDGKNQVVGADIDMAQAIADELGVKLEISSMSFDNVLTSLQTGKADLAVAGISATDERKEVFDFSIPYYENKISFLVRKADVEKYKDLTSLESANIAAQKGTVPESMVKEQLPKAQLTSLTNMGEAVNELQAGKVDAVHMDEPVALSYAAKNADLAVAGISATDERKEVFDFSIPYYENKISFLVRKSDVEKYKDLTSLESANIAAQKGTVPEAMVKEQLPKAQLTSLTNMGEAVNELQAGKVDAVHMDEPVALSYAAKNADLAVATVSLKMKDGEANAVALRKNSADLKELVDKVIQKLKDDGTYQKYLEKAASLTEVEQ